MTTAGKVPRATVSPIAPAFVAQPCGLDTHGFSALCLCDRCQKAIDLSDCVITCATETEPSKQYHPRCADHFGVQRSALSVERSAPGGAA